MTLDYLCKQFPNYSEKEVESAYRACEKLYGKGSWDYMFSSSKLDCIWMYLEGRRSKQSEDCLQE